MAVQVRAYDKGVAAGEVDIMRQKLKSLGTKNLIKYLKIMWFLLVSIGFWCIQSIQRCPCRLSFHLCPFCWS